MPATARKTSDIEADWDVKATQSAIDAARQVVSGDGINARATIGSLSEIEWGWLVAAAIFAWIKTKSQQAVAEGCGYDEPIRSMPSRDPDPWEAGAVETILPALGDLALPWEKPIAEWPKPVITDFSWRIHKLVEDALAKRDTGAGCTIARKLSQNETERELSAAHGGPLLARTELNDNIPF